MKFVLIWFVTVYNPSGDIVKEMKDHYPQALSQEICMDKAAELRMESVINGKMADGLRQDTQFFCFPTVNAEETYNSMRGITITEMNPWN